MMDRELFDSEMMGMGPGGGGRFNEPRAPQNHVTQPRQSNGLFGSVKNMLGMGGSNGRSSPIIRLISQIFSILSFIRAIMFLCGCNNYEVEEAEDSESD